MQVTRMREQIANHVCVCVCVSQSEMGWTPFMALLPLSLSFRRQLLASWHPRTSLLHSALSTVLDEYRCPCTNQGERGELLATSFFAWARDQVTRHKGDVPQRALSDFLGSGGSCVLAPTFRNCLPVNVGSQAVAL